MTQKCLNLKTKYIESVLTKDLDYGSQWLIANELSLHLRKTESNLFGSHTRLASQSILNVFCNGLTINPKTSVRYIEAAIDQNLSCEFMVKSILKKSNIKFKFCTAGVNI